MQINSNYYFSKYNKITHPAFSSNKVRHVDNQINEDRFEKDEKANKKEKIIKTGLAIVGLALIGLAIWKCKNSAKIPDKKTPQENTAKTNTKPTKKVIKKAKKNKELTDREKKNMILKNGNIIEYTLKDNGNTFKIRKGEIVEYKNTKGEDLLKTFEEKTGENAEYKEKIEKIIRKINNKDKTYLNKVENIQFENSDIVIDANDIKKYIQNKNMPVARIRSSNGNIKQTLKPDSDTTVILEINNSGSKEKTIILKDGIEVEKTFFDSKKAIVRERIYGDYEKLTDGPYRKVNKMDNGEVEIIERCDKSGKIIGVQETTTSNGRKIKKCSWQDDADRFLHLRTVRNQKDKGKIIKQEIIYCKNIENNEYEVIKTLI